MSRGLPRPCPPATRPAGRPVSRHVTALLAALTSACVLLGLAGPSVGAPSVPTSVTPTVDRAERADRPLRYVAMGDSYSAASGVQPPDPGADPRCLRSLANYPNVITNRLRRQRAVRFRDVTCGGADTFDYFSAQYDGVPRQLDALGRRTRLVTMTIGGNNESVFSDSITQCGTLGASTGGQGSPCKDEYGRSFVRTIRNETYPALLRALRAVGRDAPRARVAILGYPWILPREGGCFPQMPVAEGDVPYLRNIQRVLNVMVGRAAERRGATYVDFSRYSEGHDACQEIGVRWIEPVNGGTNPVVVHPNALGERKMARRTMRVMRLR